jgi:hypothetical protein
VVFHAAAYKHVPLMEEDNAWQAVRNNVLGTLRGRAPRRCGRVEKVRADLHRQGGQPDQRDGRHQAPGRDACVPVARAGAAAPTQFVIVRFGNVLGSTGSVIPRSSEQIAAAVR